ncbi:MAG: hypothetical protein COA38_00025 [Fluviicola sp.]|nr:MAG: hypothetical protein COA38_00025 [Fluviicola sp.]
MKIGLLLPQSKVYATMGKDFVNGLRLLNIDGLELVIEGIGFGNDTDLITSKMDKLVMQDDVAAIIGLVGDFGLDSLYDKANGLEIPAVFARLGAFPNIQLDKNEYAFTLSYGLSEGLYQLGDWFVENDYKNVATSGSFNDIGYGLTYALESSLYKGGGEFTGHHSTPLQPRENEAAIAEDFYKTIDCDVVCMFYNGDFAKEKVEYIESFQDKISKPMMFTSFGLTGDQLQTVSRKAQDVMMFAPWIPVDLKGKPDTFDTLYNEKHDRYPNVNNWLGYQTGIILRDLVPKRKELLGGAELMLDENAVCKKDLIVSFPQAIWKAEKKADKAVMVKQSSLDASKNIKVPFEGQVNGWHNAYLCY